MDQLIVEDNRKASATKPIISNLDGYLSATQLGITIASLDLGCLGEVFDFISREMIYFDIISPDIQTKK